MIFRLERFARVVHRYASRNHWLVKILGLEDSSGIADSERKPGLIMLQIDGLSRTELQHSLDCGTMPFLGKLLEREHFHLHSLYSGVPSGTPAVQGELFYGLRGCVPAFSFKRHQDGKVVIMLEPAAAASVEAELQQQGGKPLLQDGSAYSNIFSGGAREASFCAASLGWSSVMPTNNPLKMGIYAVLNIYSFMRVAVLMILELLLAVIDFFRGLIEGRDLFQELKFVPTRVAACVLLRELVTIGVKLDAERGLPIIHANFIGYDEQAHRRGPRSKFAHWGLRGIDNAIARIWRTAQRSEYRNYDVWIYSDHGQQATKPSVVDFPLGILPAIQSIFARYGPAFSQQSNAVASAGEANADDAVAAMQAQKKAIAAHTESGKLWSGRANWLGTPGFEEWTPAQTVDDVLGKTMPEVVAMGPVGFIYSPTDLSEDEKVLIAEALVQETAIPVVMMLNPQPTANSSVLAWTADGQFQLPRDKQVILGIDHPFLEEAGEDLVSLVQHPSAGDLVIFGWRCGAQALSFRIENGAHGGSGPDETHAFALLPGDTPLLGTGQNYLRLMNLREAAFNRLGRALEDSTVDPPVDQLPAGSSKVSSTKALTVMPNSKAADKMHCLRVLTYNIHSCVGMDGKVSTTRIARVIAQYQPDVVALQELDIRCEESADLDQAQLIADALGMDISFHPIRYRASGRFGNAILTDLPMRLIKAEKLASHHGFARELRGRALNQPRGALWVEIEFNGTPVSVITTHLGLTPKERQLQVDELLSEQWLGHPDCKIPVVLCGDFNAAPSQQAYRRLAKRLNDAQVQLRGHKPKKTFSGRYPAVRLDHVFVDPSIGVEAIAVPRDSLAKVASDHLPLVVDLELP